MATSGQVNTNTTYDSYFWVKWEQVDQDVVSNKTSIKWSCGVYCGHSFYSNAIKMSAVTINGVRVYGGGTYSNYSKGNHTIASGQLDIQHNTDGTKTFSISAFTGWLYSGYNYSSSGGSYSLTQIPRKATITAAVDFTDVDNPSITFNNPGGFRMDVWLEPNPVGDHLCVRENIPNIGTYTWSLTADEREALRSKCPRNSCTIRLGLYTYIGGEQYADYKDKTYTMTENAETKPTVSMTVSPVSTLGEPFKSLYIQGKSKVKANLAISAKYGASIEAYWIKVEGIDYSYPYESAVLSQPGTQKIQAIVRDSRGFYGYAETTIDVIAYSKPSVNVIAYRCNSSGDADSEGAYMRLGFEADITSINGKNSARYTINYGGTPISGTGTSYLSEPIACDVSRAWPVEVTVSDEIDATTKAGVVPIAFTLMDFYHTGMGVSLGKVATRDGFDCAMPAYFTGGVYIGEKTLAQYIADLAKG